MSRAPCPLTRSGRSPASGTVTWYDHNLGRGRIEDSSGTYAVEAEDMAPHARVDGARVDFVVARAERTDRVVHVTLRSGTRHNPK